MRKCYGTGERPKCTHKGVFALALKLPRGFTSPLHLSLFSNDTYSFLKRSPVSKCSAQMKNERLRQKENKTMRKKSFDRRNEKRKNLTWIKLTHLRHPVINSCLCVRFSWYYNKFCIKVAYHIKSIVFYGLKKKTRLLKKYFLLICLFKSNYFIQIPSGTKKHIKLLFFLNSQYKLK